MSHCRRQSRAAPCCRRSNTGALPKGSLLICSRLCRQRFTALSWSFFAPSTAQTRVRRRACPASLVSRLARLVCASAAHEKHQAQSAGGAVAAAPCRPWPARRWVAGGTSSQAAGASMPAWLDKIKGGLGLAEEEPAEQTLLQQLDEATTLDRTQVRQGGGCRRAGLPPPLPVHRRALGCRPELTTCIVPLIVLQRVIGFATCVGIGLLLSFMVRVGGGDHLGEGRREGEEGRQAARGEVCVQAQQLLAGRRAPHRQDRCRAPQRCRACVVRPRCTEPTQPASCLRRAPLLRHTRLPPSLYSRRPPLPCRRPPCSSSAPPSSRPSTAWAGGRWRRGRAQALVRVERVTGSWGGSPAHPAATGPRPPSSHLTPPRPLSPLLPLCCSILSMCRWVGARGRGAARGAHLLRGKQGGVDVAIRAGRATRGVPARFHPLLCSICQSRINQI